MRGILLNDRTDVVLDCRSNGQAVMREMPPTNFAPSLSLKVCAAYGLIVLHWTPLAAAGKTGVISAKPNRVEHRQLDRHMYGTRHLIGIFFGKITQFRAIATRYDKTARNFLAAAHLVAIDDTPCIAKIQRRGSGVGCSVGETAPP